MARRKKGELPRYRLHKQSGHAVVSLPLGGGKYRDFLLGPFDSEDSKREYTRVINEWLAGGMLAPAKVVSGRCPDLSVSEVCLRFWKYAEAHYRLADGSPSRELQHFKYALMGLVNLYADTPAADFGPLKFKAVRQAMIDGTWLTKEERERRDQQKRPVRLCRKLINQRMDHIRRLFKWAVSEQLVPVSVYESLRTVAGLRRGHQGTYDKPKVKPVPQGHVEAVLPFLMPQLAAMVRLQQLIGARPTEVCVIRGRNIDRSGPVWWYRIDPNEAHPEGQPDLHKTTHRENADGTATVKVLSIGPKAQAVLQPWLRDNPDEYLFQPREARQAWLAERRKGRKTPLWRSHVAHQARKRKEKPQRAPSDHYTRHSYAQAVTRACKKAGVPHWHPHQLKHACGTDVRKAYGLEAARAFMGHTKLGTAEIYAEKDMALMERIAQEMG